MINGILIVVTIFLAAAIAIYGINFLNQDVRDMDYDAVYSIKIGRAHV